MDATYQPLFLLVLLTFSAANCISRGYFNSNRSNDRSAEVYGVWSFLISRIIQRLKTLKHSREHYIIRRIWSEVWVSIQLYSTTKSSLMWKDFWFEVSDICSFQIFRFLRFRFLSSHFELWVFSLSTAWALRTIIQMTSPASQPIRQVNRALPPPPAPCRDYSCPTSEAPWRIGFFFSLFPLLLHVKKNWLRQQSCRGCGV